MGLGDRIKEIEAQSLSSCGVAKVHRAIKDPKEASAFMGFINSTVKASVLAEACKREGYVLQPSTILRHRKGHCNCEKK